MHSHATGIVTARLIALAALAAVGSVVFGAWAVTPVAGAARRGGAVPPLYDRTYKCDRVEFLPEPPELVIYGGSRAQRFKPSVVERLTGLPAFNFALQNSRPEDVYAITRHLFWRDPEVKLRCVWALQVTTLVDSPLHPGLLGEERLTRFLPAELIAAQRALGAKPMPGVQWDHEYSGRGSLLRNSYDQREEQGVGLEKSMRIYLARMAPRAATPSAYPQTRARRYFERTLRLFNLHGVEPVLVIMPYHPTALAAFREVGWQAKADGFAAYLRGLEGEYDFHLLDYTEIESFGGTPEGFYDGSHIKSVNARRILSRAVKDAPGAFR